MYVLREQKPNNAAGETVAEYAYDAESDLCYYGHRFYAPGLHRWLWEGRMRELVLLLVVIAGFLCGCSRSAQTDVLLTSDGKLVLDGENLPRADLDRGMRAARQRGGRVLYVRAERGLRAVDVARILWSAEAAQYGTNLYVRTSSGDVHIWSGLPMTGDLGMYLHNRPAVAVDLAERGVRIGTRRYSAETRDVDVLASGLTASCRERSAPAVVVFAEKQARSDLLLDIFASFLRHGCHEFVLLVYDQLPTGEEDSVCVSGGGMVWRGFVLDSDFSRELAYAGLTALRAGAANDGRHAIPVSVHNTDDVGSAVDMLRPLRTLGGQCYELYPGNVGEDVMRRLMDSLKREGVNVLVAEEEPKDVSSR